MTRKRRWLWIVLFIWLAVLLASLATGWNVVLVRHYQRVIELARDIAPDTEVRKLVIGIVLGSLGFAAALGTMVIFFVRLLREMRLTQLQSEFLATVSHELKTPIASIELSSSLLRDKPLNDSERVELWQSHAEELKRLRAEVETLLEAARWQSGLSRIRREPIVLETWIESSMPRWRKLIGSEGRLRREGDSIPDATYVDLRALALIVDNLIDNARKFSRGAPDLVVRTQRLPSLTGRPRWRIEFCDSGWGFDPADSRRIFTRFFRAPTDAPYAIPGTGLGLFLAESASRAQGMHLSGTSPGRGQGARFVLEGQIRRRP